MKDPALELLRTRPDLADLAAFPFDFDIARAYHVEDVRLASGAPLEPVAGDDTGGTYFVCGDGAVLYASSEGEAVLIADSVTEALETIIRLPRWCEGIRPGLDEEQLLVAAVREGDEEAREQFAPELDARRAALLSGLGLPERPLVELAAMAESAARRTEPDHVLLNAHELGAYRLPGDPPRRSLRDVVLAPGREALERMRSGEPGSWEEVGADAVLRAGVIRAAQYDRRADDLPLLCFLLERENTERTDWFHERLSAAVLVGLHGRTEDVQLLREATGGWVTDAEGAVSRARKEDEECHGQDPAAESEFTWIELARRQGRTEHARVALIRMLDDTGPDAERLRELSRALERLGDHAQAARAQSDLLSLQDTGWDRAAEAHVLARLELRKGDLGAARRALERARTAVGLDGAAPDATVSEWHRRGLGRMITEQHLELVITAVEAGEADLARETMRHGKVLLKSIADGFRSSLGDLPARATWAVARLGRGPS